MDGLGRLFPVGVIAWNHFQWKSLILGAVISDFTGMIAGINKLLDLLLRKIPFEKNGESVSNRIVFSFPDPFKKQKFKKRG